MKPIGSVVDNNRLLRAKGARLELNRAWPQPNSWFSSPAMARKEAASFSVGSATTPSLPNRRKRFLSSPAGAEPLGSVPGGAIRTGMVPIVHSPVVMFSKLKCRPLWAARKACRQAEAQGVSRSVGCKD